MKATRRAVVLLSGGLDSTTTLAVAAHEGFEIYALSFRYGQRHAFELEAASRVAHRYGVAKHLIFDVDLSVFGGSALTSPLEVPKDRSAEAMAVDIPVTYVPARNTVFLAIAMAWAEVLGSTDIFLGVNALDYSGYPDCRPEFIDAFARMANLATRAGVEGSGPLRIHTPLLHMSKAEIVRHGVELGVDYSITSTCYDPAPNGTPCGLCDACQLRLKGFTENGMQDPLAYVARSA